MRINIRTKGKEISIYVGCISGLIRTTFTKENKYSYEAITRRKIKINVLKTVTYTAQKITK